MSAKEEEKKLIVPKAPKKQKNTAIPKTISYLKLTLLLNLFIILEILSDLSLILFNINLLKSFFLEYSISRSCISFNSFINSL